MEDRDPHLDACALDSSALDHGAKLLLRMDLGLAFRTPMTWSFISGVTSGFLESPHFPLTWEPPTTGNSTICSTHQN